MHLFYCTIVFIYYINYMRINLKTSSVTNRFVATNKNLIRNIEINS